MTLTAEDAKLLDKLPGLLDDAAYGRLDADGALWIRTHWDRLNVLLSGLASEVHDGPA